MRIDHVLFLSVLVALGAPFVRAEEDAPRAARTEPLRFLRVNRWGAEEWLRSKDGAVMIRIPGGEYLKRPYEGWEAEEEPKPVPVAGFFVDQHETTNAQYAAFLNDQPSARGLVWLDVPGLLHRAGAQPAWAPVPGLGRHPVVAATGEGALAYARWVGARLPTANEWEKAAGGPGARMFPWGATSPDGHRANFGRPAPRGTMPVGSYAGGASPYGVMDMAGNAYDRVMTPTRDGHVRPTMLKGGSWLSPHPLNLRVLDMCMQPTTVADGSVGFRLALSDWDPGRTPRRPARPVPLKIRTRFEKAVEEARTRRVPIFLSLQYDTCGQCDRTRHLLFRDPRFVAFANEHVVVLMGHQPGDGWEDPHPPGEEDACPLYPGLTCDQHELIFAKGLQVVGGFAVSPGNFVLHPDRVRPGAGAEAILVREASFPKWGNAVDAYLAALEEGVRRLAAEKPPEGAEER